MPARTERRAKASLTARFRLDCGSIKTIVTPANTGAHRPTLPTGDGVRVMGPRVRGGDDAG